jgi:putative mRNA 3-end processing factor
VALLEVREPGLYCPAGDFYIDPRDAVDRAVITHAHSNHVRIGSRRYLTARPGEELLRAVLGELAAIEGVEYGERVAIGDTAVSLHPAGHILGSAQVRIEHRGEVWVMSGDYKLTPDPTCAPFEPIRCHTFVTESSFALPIFRWPEESETIAAIHAWWKANRESGKASLLFAAPLGKAQRVLAALDCSIGLIYTPEVVEKYNCIYRGQGIALPATLTAKPAKGALILAPPNLRGTDWAKSLGAVSTALASGWMRVRGTRRRRSLDRGFVLGGHADWPGLLRAIDETRAETVWVMHGFRAPLVRWLEEHGRQAVSIEARFEEAES